MLQIVECTAPESNQSCDEWMTLIEMQGCMRASRKKGERPHLVRRDRLVHARQETPGIEGICGHPPRVEEQQEMKAATAPRAARGRAREGASRRKEFEDDHNQEH